MENPLPRNPDLLARLRSGLAGPSARTSALLLCAAAAACSGGQPQSGADAALAQQGEYSAEAAVALSLSSGPGLADSDSFETSIECAAAIDRTVQLLGGQSAMLPPGSMNSLRRASSYYRERAVKAAPIENTPARTLAVIEEQTQRTQGSSAQQVRLAMECLKEISQVR